MQFDQLNSILIDKLVFDRCRRLDNGFVYNNSIQFPDVEVTIDNINTDPICKFKYVPNEEDSIEHTPFSIIDKDEDYIIEELHRFDNIIKESLVNKDGECYCDLCKRHKEFTRILNKISKHISGKEYEFLTSLYQRLENTEFDLSLAECDKDQLKEELDKVKESSKSEQPL